MPNIDFLATPGVVRPSAELPIELVNQHEFLRMAVGCTAPLLVLTAGAPELEDILEMAAAIAGGRDALRARPFVTPYLNPVSPGLYNPETLDKLIITAEWGIPVVCQPAPQVGATTPVTLAGAIALSNAESLAGLVIGQLVREGTPYISGVIPMSLDMRNGAAVAAGPVTPLMQYAAMQLARRYGLPALADCGSSDAKLLTPVNFTRISSKFTTSRFHSVLHRFRSHKGVDYAASTGPPVRSSGDGKIVFRGRKGGYGNAIIIQHGSRYTTLYGHLSKFNSNVSTGSKVKQGRSLAM